MIIAWWSVIAATLFWGALNARQEHHQFVIQTARYVFKHVVLTRSWNAKHGGVYVPVTAETQPNSYLDGPDRDIVVDARLTLTKINPAYMTRQIGEIAAEHEGIQLHITSLDPIRPENSPSDLERLALQRFEQGDDEYSRFLHEEGEDKYFYMAPLTTTRRCLKCHERQGYGLGDIRGGISLTFPHTHPARIGNIVFTYLTIGMIGTLLILLFARKLASAYEAVRQQSILDALTGIANRRYCIEHLLLEYRRARRDRHPLSLLICDIDYFKKYNDKYGHLEGDNCLVRVANTISGELRRGGDLCSRYGGEEFVVVLPETDRPGACILAERIRQAIEALKIPHAASSISNYVTLSIGLAAESEEYDSHESLLKRADEALYRAKRKGRNRICSAETDTRRPTIRGLHDAV